MVVVSTPLPFPRGPVVLIGPLAVGKSTVSVALASLVGSPMCSVDEIRWQYFDEIGYDRAEATRRYAAGQTPAEKLAYGMPFEVYAIEQIMVRESFGVIDFGASNSVYEDPVLLARVRAALSEAYVVMLLPSEDPAESEQILAARLRAILHAKGEVVSDELLVLNAFFIRHSSSRRLAQEIVYTSGRGPSAIAAEIAQSYEALQAGKDPLERLNRPGTEAIDD